MDRTLARIYYSRPDIEQRILEFARDREIGVMFDGFFGKRPDVLENVQDIRQLVSKGVFSFHMSCEKWLNPLLLSEKLSPEDRLNNQLGWDLILDLDGVDFEYARLLCKIIVDFLLGLGVKNVSVKFSGNKGFHIGVPFEAFSSSIIGIGETRTLFPEAPKRISAYLLHELKGKISKAILERDGSVEKIAEKYGFAVSDLVCDDLEMHNLDFLKLIEIDTILITSRHLFRMPYSMNEKSELVSVPIALDKIMLFQRHWAKPGFVKPDFNRRFEFLKYNSEFGKDADILLVKSYEDDYYDKISESISERIEQARSGEFKLEITEKIEIKDFPATIQYVLASSFEDGRKRALFLLLTFLFSVKWEPQHIEDLVFDWNSRQKEPLKDNYVTAQVSWFKHSQKSISTPAFSNDNYYKNIGIPAEILAKDRKAFLRDVKSPLHYVYILLQNKSKNAPKKRGKAKQSKEQKSESSTEKK